MRFGIFIPQGWVHDLVDIEPAEHWATIREIALAAESGPWESVWLYDHFHTVPVPTSEATHETWSLVSALAAVTSRIRIGQMCTCIGFRNPAYLAKVAATADHISGGRIEMGIGAGWYEHEWRAYGYGFPLTKERLGMLREGVEILAQAWRDGSATLDGEHFRVDGAICRPLPLQEGGIPIWIAGGGERRTLRIAAQYGSAANFMAFDIDTFRRKRTVLAEHCAAIGRDPEQIRRSANFSVIVGESAADVVARIRRVEQRLARFVGDAAAAAQVAEYRDGTALAGTPEDIGERLAAWRDAGLQIMLAYFPEAAYDRSGIELFEQRVIPALAAEEPRA